MIFDLSLLRSAGVFPPRIGRRVSASRQVVNADRPQSRYSVSELAAYWRCSEKLVTGLIRSGALRAFDLAAPTAKKRKYVISAESIAEYESKREVRAESQQVYRPRLASHASAPGHFDNYRVG